MSRYNLSDYREGYMSERSRSRISAPTSLDASLDISSPIKALELRELQEEENWIRTLKMQRDRVTDLRLEIAAKDNRIAELESQLNTHKSTSNSLLHLQSVLEKTESQAKIREKDLLMQLEQLKKQLRDYQLAVEDLRETMREDQEVYQREMQKIRSQAVKDQEELMHLRTEYEKGRGLKAHTEELVEIVRKESKERETQLIDQVQSSRAVEKQLKDQVSQLSYEKATVEAKVKDLYLILTDQEKQIASFKEVELAYQSAVIQIEQLKSASEKQTYEIALLREAKDSAKSRAGEDFRLLQEDLEMCTQLVKRQEQTISELRKRKAEDDEEFQALTFKLQKAQKELTLIRESSRMENEERSQLMSKIDSLAAEIDRLKTENSDIAKQLEAMIEKEAVERRQKEEYARLRLELINMRNKEMAAFSDALEGVAARRFEV